MFLVGTLLRFGFFTAWLFQIVACMGCCLGCDANHKLIIDQQSQSQGQPKSTFKPCMEDDTWTSSSRCDMDRGNTSHGFVNHGLLMWNQNRQQWIGDKKNKRDPPRQPRLSRNATYESLLGSNKPFAKPIPLSEMVNFLVDVWDEEGLYD